MIMRTEDIREADGELKSLAIGIHFVFIVLNHDDVLNACLRLKRLHFKIDEVVAGLFYLKYRQLFIFIFSNIPHVVRLINVNQAKLIAYGIVN